MRSIMFHCGLQQVSPQSPAQEAMDLQRITGLPEKAIVTADDAKHRFFIVFPCFLNRSQVKVDLALAFLSSLLERRHSCLSRRGNGHGAPR